MQNSYLEEVVAGTQVLEESLRSRLDPSPGTYAADSDATHPAIHVRVNGWWRWKNVVVPPNAFVVHTRRGVNAPLNCGLGVSFRYNPYTDAFLVAPAAMQTIIVNANCICQERQGVMVQAYVQWIIDDFSRAYQRLDLSDESDPMRVTNVQLRQQAEATIKDTVATMNIDAVLSDKQPIIEELTRRLQEAAEGTDGEAGLGIRIVTVQIKEAVVSSATLWETLQRGFRAERTKEARLAELTAQSVVNQRESAEALKADRVSIEKDDTIRQLRHESKARAFDSEQAEHARRARLEAELAAEQAEHRREVLEQAATLERLEARFRDERRALDFELEIKEDTGRLEVLGRRMALENEISPEQLRARLIESLPEIAERLPTPKSLRIYDGAGAGQLGHLVSGVVEALETFGTR